MVIKLLYFLLSLYIFIKTTSYAIYELKEEQNKVACFSIMSLNIIYVIVTNILVWIR